MSLLLSPQVFFGSLKMKVLPVSPHFLPSVLPAYTRSQRDGDSVPNVELII